jgi:hypothetical protein
MPNNAGQPDTDNVDIGRRADHYRKHGTSVASSVSVLFRDNTFEVRAVPLRTAMTTPTLQ